MGEATLGLEARRSNKGYTAQRKSVGRRPSAFEALVIGVISLALCVAAEAHRIVIDLSEQRVFLLEGSQVLLCSPIASGKTWLQHANREVSGQREGHRPSFRELRPDRGFLRKGC